MRVVWRLALLTGCFLLLNSCANYYSKHGQFNHEFEKGDLRIALETLKQNSKGAQGRDRFIYFLNNGLLHSMLGEYEESNSYFEKAFLFGEDFRINYLNEAASYFSNATVTTYKGEDHEHLMLLYFKALNFLKLNKPEEALVECRRLNIRLNQLNDKYSSSHKLQRDAFIHTLMGVIYQSSKDYNNAFIAYRNAVEVYEDEYATLFNTAVPEQLKRDLLNTALWTGFNDEFAFYKEKFGMDDYTPGRPDAELVFFWHNGLAPVKDEWSINFVIDRAAEDLVYFRNDQLGMAFPYQLREDKDRSALKSIEVFRVAFPRYVERRTYYKSAAITMGEDTFNLEMSEDISKIAVHSLKQRMLEECSKGLLRVAVKKATEYTARKEDEGLGAILGLMNAITEHADTRNWQTLPHSIHYARVPLKEGTNTVSFSLKSSYEKPTVYNFSYNAKAGQTLFHTFSSLESMSGLPRYY